jgi:hypothetical protein
MKTNDERMNREPKEENKRSKGQKVVKKKKMQVRLEKGLKKNRLKKRLGRLRL